VTGRPLRARKPDAKFVRINITLPVDVFDEVKARAEETERPISNMLTILLRRALEEDED
jgi:CopG-like RHH_1 or ribbon-helix-helix domain, RHH_5